MIIDRAVPITTRDRHKRSSHPTTRTDNSRPISDGTEDKAKAISSGVQPTTNQRNRAASNDSITQDSGFPG